MGLAVLVVRVNLALVFLVAASGKLRDVAGSRQAVANFGVPARAARLLGALLPVGEVFIAAALLFTPSARWASVAAIVLLLAFVFVIGRAMQQGRAPECHCFGQLHSEPAGTAALIRNGMLVAAAVLVAAWGPGRAIRSLSGEDGAVALLSIATVALGAATASISRENRQLRTRGAAVPVIGPGLPVGTRAPEIALRNLDGQTVRLRDLLGRGGPAVILHISPQCAPCRAMAPDIKRWQKTLSEQLTLLVLCSAEEQENVEFANDLAMTSLLLAQPGVFVAAYEAPATPSAVLVDEHARIAARTAAGQLAIEALIRMTLRREQPGRSGDGTETPPGRTPAFPTAR